MKMKKTIIFTLIGLIVLAGTTAYIATNKEDMISYFNTYKTNRESEMTNAETTITYTTDKECMIDYYSEEIKCKVCFKFDIGSLHIGERCLNVGEDTTEKQDDEAVKVHVREFVEEHYPIEEIKYIKTEMKDREISI